MLSSRALAHLRRLCVTTTAIAVGAGVLLVPLNAATAADNGGSKPTSQASTTYDLARGTTTNAEARALLSEITSDLPADWQSRLLQARTDSRVGDEVIDQVRSAINPADYTCGPTSIDAYVSRQLSGVPDDTLFVLALVGIFEFPTYDAIYFGKAGKGYRISGKPGRQLTKSFGGLQKFWDIKSKNIDLMGMQPSMVADKARVAKVAKVVYKIKNKKADKFAKAVVKLVKGTKKLKKGRNPIFSLNAVAFTGKGVKNKRLRKVGDRIIFGSGMIKAYKSLGYGKFGPRSVLAHEFGHHIQFDRKLIASSLEPAEAGRRVEMMADSMATYFMGHRKGLDASTSGRRQSVESFRLVGDCVFDDPSHHGTPNQRAKAATYGLALADASGKSIRKGRSVGASFDAALPQLVAPDAV